MAPGSRSSDPFFVYILQCADASYYVGHTHDVEARVRTHNDGKGAIWTKCRRPVRLVYSEPLADEASAIERERQLKRWSAEKKRALIEGRVRDLKRLSQNRGLHALSGPGGSTR